MINTKTVIDNQTYPIDPTLSSQNISSLSQRNLSGRDLIVINPIYDLADGSGGDAQLANKIANIALEQNCRVSILPIDTDRPGNALAARHHATSESVHQLSDLRDPLFIVAPVGVLKLEDLKTTMNNLCTQYNFPRKDIMLIEEMDLLASPRQQLPDRVNALKELGFEGVSAHNLGFGEGAIGYLPIEKKDLDLIEKRFDNDIRKLLDSYNLSLDKNSNFHMAYISSDTPVTASHLFIRNTLNETASDKKNTTYLIVARDLPNLSRKRRFIDDVGNIFHPNYSIAVSEKAYSKASLYTFSDSGRGMVHQKTFLGAGDSEVKVIVVKHVPQPIFHDLMKLSSCGMASGDQSLGEYLSIKKSVPYYDMQQFKYPLARALVLEAERLGGTPLGKQMERKVVGGVPHSMDTHVLFSPNEPDNLPRPELIKASMRLDEKISSHTADGHIREFLSGPPPASTH